MAYAKVAGAVQSSGSQLAYGLGARPEGHRVSWHKWLRLAVLVGGLVWGIQVAHKRYGGASGAGEGSRSELTTEQIRVLASAVKAGEVVMYSTTECVYCAQTKGWLTQNGFTFTECNMSLNRECEREFLSYGGNGTPYLVVRGRHMKNGFDSDQFLALLSGQ